MLLPVPAVLEPSTADVFAPPFPAPEGVDEVAPPPCVQGLLRSAVGDGPADVVAPRHVDPDGVPAPWLPSAWFAEKSSEAVDGPLPQLVPRLASVGTPGEASAMEQLEARVGSSADPIPVAEPPNAPVAVAMTFASTRESEVETLDRLASAFADGPVVVGAGADPLGAVGLGCNADAVVGTVARVPGAVAELEPRDGEFGAVVFELDAVIGSLVAAVAGPAPPPVAEAEPPAVDPCGSGRASGCAENAGLSARTAFPKRSRSAMTAISSSSFFIF